METELVIIGGSAGSLQVIIELIRNLEADLSFPIILVVHRKAQSVSILPSLLQQYSKIEVSEIEDKTELEINKIYIAPADYHLLFDDKINVSLDRSEKLHFSRPSIDVSFSSASEVFGEKLVSILLSGANSDGVEGLQHVKNNGGKVWIQDPDTAQVDYMPRQAVEQVRFDRLITSETLPNDINELNKNN